MNSRTIQWVILCAFLLPSLIAFGAVKMGFLVETKVNRVPSGTVDAAPATKPRENSLAVTSYGPGDQEAAAEAEFRATRLASEATFLKQWGRRVCRRGEFFPMLVYQHYIARRNAAIQTLHDDLNNEEKFAVETARRIIPMIPDWLPSCQ